MSNVKDVIAQNLVRLRRQSKMTQTELAEKLNYTDKSVSKWEHGECTPPIDVLKALADLYGVTVDYLLRENEGIPLPTKNENDDKKTNKLIITLLATSLVWIIATVLYVSILTVLNTSLWILFVFAVPVSIIVLIVFNAIWGRRGWTFILISVGIWSLLASFYLLFIQYNLWAIFIAGVPLQVATVLWSQLKTKNNKIK